MKKKEPISLFNIFAENLSSNELGLKTKNKVTAKDHPIESNPHKEEIGEILKDFSELTEHADALCKNLKQKIDSIENEIKNFKGEKFSLIYHEINGVSIDIHSISGNLGYYIDTIKAKANRILNKK